ncbi:glycosyltransferase [Rhodospira trueperi]|uniref:Glycosyltransferase, GT2 family n=1 Tax=Rhodospira trueperi TaxID=69960 RepID=A0A1G7GR86_9PROT|nr:glycosyltransferase family 2 protein [Rhodospira trueperi]SDE90553.1 Glycosyltransferase, GT2 family [Rhodospira trueperi]
MTRAQPIEKKTDSENGILFSVVVCTYNRAKLLETLLESLTEQAADPMCFEVIVVDNNSHDETKSVCAAAAKRLTNFVYSHEPKQGLSHARNNGYRAARGVYVAYLDDECLVPRDWLLVAQRHARDARPEMMGGPYSCHFEGKRPAWARDSYFSTVESAGQEMRALGAEQFIDGGNMFIMRSKLEELGGFDAAFGMSGNRLGYAEEVDFQKRLVLHDPKATRLFDPALAVSHMVRKQKLGLWFIVRSRYANGLSQGTLRFDEVKNNYDLRLGAFFKFIIRELWHLSRNVFEAALRRDRQRFPYFLNALFEEGFTPLERIGVAVSVRRQAKRTKHQKN